MEHEYSLTGDSQPTWAVESPRGPDGLPRVAEFSSRLVCAGISGIRTTGSTNCWIAILMVVACFWAPSFGQTVKPANSQVAHDFWGFKEGAPENVVALAQSSDGFLWLGTPTGLFRFDGTRFELFHSRFGDSLLSTNVSALFGPPSGGLWIAYTFGGFSFLKDGRVTNYGGEIASATGTVWNFAQSLEGTVWATGNSGLWRFDGSHWQHAGVESSLEAGPISEARFDQHGTLWALQGVRSSTLPAKLLYLRPGSSSFQTAESDISVDGFTLDADGKVVTSPENRTFHDDSVDRSHEYPVLRKDSAQIIDRTKSVWIVPKLPGIIRVPAGGRLSEALNNVSPSNSETFNVNPFNTANLVDREGNIWFGDPKGLHRFFYSPLTGQVLPKRAFDFHFFTVTADAGGAVWIVAGDVAKPSSIYRVDEDGVKLRKAPGLISALIGFAYRSPDTTVWLGGEAGLWHLAGGDWRRVELPMGMSDKSHFLQTITQDRKGGMWVSFGRHGLYRLADGAWTAYGGHDDLPKTGVVIEFTDSLGRVWFGYTKNTLAMLDGEQVRVFGSNDGLRIGNITAVYGRGSEIWIGGDFGLQQFDHGRFHAIRAADEEWLRGISGIVETANGDLWLNGLGGVSHIHRSELSEALRNSTYQVKGEHFGRREGVPGTAFYLRPLNTAVEGSDGRLWFTGSAGVAWLDPVRSEDKSPPPPITLQSVSADEKNYPLASALTFPAHTASVQINYAAVSLSDPETIRFRYKLQETDKGWHEVSAAGPVSYRNLAPGLYHFTVNSSDTDGAWSDAVATMEFTILPAFYQTSWFITLCVVSAIALMYMLYMFRLRQLARQYGMRERLLQLEAELAHVNRVSMLGVMAASLAHEIKQPIAAAITSANSCIEWLAHEPPNLDRARAAASRIDKYGNRAAEIIDHIRSFYKKSPPQRELVDVNGIVQEILILLQDEACRCSVVMGTDLSAELPEIKVDRVQLQQVFMNLMLNAIEAMKDSGGGLMVKSQLQDCQLRFSVSDNGVGLPAEKVDQIFSAFFTTKPQGSGMGLAISRSIVESHGGQLWATANDGRGATFHFTLPIQTTESSPLVA